ncbi:hypothetical protein HBB16_13150, partial [Pseudonocardia sp. MCCB 268]|nr:hypothetical protein [Pseudonocardia cytotoxica]
MTRRADQRTASSSTSGFRSRRATRPGPDPHAAGPLPRGEGPRPDAGCRDRDSMMRTVGWGCTATCARARTQPRSCGRCAPCCAARACSTPGTGGAGPPRGVLRDPSRAGAVDSVCDRLFNLWQCCQ